jgi:hypothetical protein
LKIFQFVLGGAEEHVIGEEIVACSLCDDAEVEPVAIVGADIAVSDEYFGQAVEPGRDGVEDAIEIDLVDGLVEVVPVDG